MVFWKVVKLVGVMEFLMVLKLVEMKAVLKVAKRVDHLAER